VSDLAQVRAWLHEESLSGRDRQRATDALLFVNRHVAEVERLREALRDVMPWHPLIVDAALPTEGGEREGV
jgi:hypothetical protein